MTYRCLLAALVSGALLFSLSACDDSSTVGLGVGPDTLAGGQPQTVNAFPDTFSVRQTPDGPRVTSNVRPSPSDGHRILVGTVNDPLVGTMMTRGHIDFTQPAAADSVSAIVRADLILEPEYRYGSTTDQQTVTVHRATNEIQENLPSDTTILGVGAEITSGSFVSADTLVTIPLPDDWVSSNRADLLNTSDGEDDGYDARFKGLVLAPSAGNHVMGFNRRASRLRLITDNVNGDRDTLEYFGAKSFTYIERSGSPSVPEGNELLVDGSGEELVTSIDFDGPPFTSIGRVPLNRTEFVIPIDTLALQEQGPTNFTRPTADGFLLLGKLTDEFASSESESNGQFFACRSILQVATVGRSCALTIQRTNNGLMVQTELIQRVLELVLEDDEQLFSEYVLEFSSSKPSITPVLLRRPNPDNPAGSTRLQLTYVPQR